MNIENKNSRATIAYNAIGDLIQELERQRDEIAGGFPVVHEIMLKNLYFVFDQIRSVHPDFWEPNPQDNPELFDADGEIRPLTKAEFKAITPLSPQEIERQEEGYKQLLQYGLIELLSMLKTRHGVSKKEVAERSGVSQTLLSQYQSGYRPVSLPFLMAVAGYWGYNVGIDMGLRKIEFKSRV